MPTWDHFWWGTYGALNGFQGALFFMQVAFRKSDGTEWDWWRVVVTWVGLVLLEIVVKKYGMRIN